MAGKTGKADKDPAGTAKNRTRNPKGAHGEPVSVEVDGHDVTVTNPGKVFFSARGETKLDLVRYYIAVGPGALRGVLHRPTVLKRFPDGAEGPSFFQKRMPATRPAWLETVTVTFPSGRSAEELCPADVAHIAWAANLGCLDLNPWPVRSADLDHPDELRIDLDPQPGVAFDVVRQVALAAREVLDEHALTGFPKTSGSRGIHVLVPIIPAHGFTQVRRAALALARELERRRPDAATSAWWKESAASACSSTTTRTPATGRWPPPIPFATTPRAVCRARSTGPRCPTSTRPTSRWRRCPPATPNAATRSSTSTTKGSTSSHCSSWRPGTKRAGWATRRGRRTSPSKRGNPAGRRPAGGGEVPDLARRLGRGPSRLTEDEAPVPCPRTSVRGSRRRPPAGRSSSSGPSAPPGFPACTPTPGHDK